MNDRLNRLISLFSKIEGVKVTEDYIVRGTSLRKLAETNGGGYQRVLKWAEGKVPKKASEPAPIPVNPEMQELKMIHKHCWEVMNGRNQKYGSSWKVLTIQSIANLIEMKMTRIANMAEQNLDPKLVDEFVDASNYAVMALKKLQDKGIVYKHD